MNDITQALFQLGLGMSERHLNQFVMFLLCSFVELKTRRLMKVKHLGSMLYKKYQSCRCVLQILLFVSGPDSMKSNYFFNLPINPPNFFLVSFSATIPVEQASRKILKLERRHWPHQQRTMEVVHLEHRLIGCETRAILRDV